MKRFYQLVAVAIVTLVLPMVASAPVSAAFVCDIGFTGPNTENLCVSKETYTCTVKNKNEVSIINATEQTVASGSAKVSEDGTGGGAISGSASNTNDATFNVTIDNGTECKVAALVVPAKEEPEKPTTSAKPAEAKGKGETAAPVQPAKTAAPAALPVTSGSDAPAVIVLTSSAAILAAITVAYRRMLP